MILKILNVIIHEHGMSFHLFGSFNFFQQSFLVFKVEYKFGTSFLKFIPKHIILFSAIVNEIVFLILF